MLNSDQHSTPPQMPEQAAAGTLAAEQLAAIKEGAALKDLYGISDGVMNTVYACAYDKYQSGQLDEALLLFRFLVTQNVYHPDYSLGLAAVLQRTREYAQAADLYTLAYWLGKNPQAMFYAGQCYLNLHNQDKAKACFIEVCNNGTDEKLLRQAQAYLAALGTQATSGEAHG